MSDYSNGGGGCGRCCCSFIFTSGLTALFMWLSLRGSTPSCSIEDFYVPSLNTTDNSTTTRSNHTLYFHLRLKNEMKDKGVGYDNITLTFYYGPNNSHPIGNYTVPRFYQGHGKKAHRKELVQQTYGMPWETAYAAVSNNSPVTFRVGLATRVRYKILFWYTKRHGLNVSANVDVNNSALTLTIAKSISICFKTQKKFSNHPVFNFAFMPQNFCFFFSSLCDNLSGFR